MSVSASVCKAAPAVVEALINSTVVALAVTLISIVIGLPAGRALGLHKFRGKRLVEFLILAPVILLLIFTSRYLSGESSTIGGFGQNSVSEAAAVSLHDHRRQRRLRAAHAR